MACAFALVPSSVWQGYSLGIDGRNIDLDAGRPGARVPSWVKGDDRTSGAHISQSGFASQRRRGSVMTTSTSLGIIACSAGH